MTSYHRRRDVITSRRRQHDVITTYVSDGKGAKVDCCIFCHFTKTAFVISCFPPCTKKSFREELSLKENKIDPKGGKK